MKKIINQNRIEILSAVIIAIVFVVSFSSSMDVFSGKNFVMSIVTLVEGLKLTIITFYVTFILLVVFGFVSLIVPNKQEIYDILRPYVAWIVAKSKTLIIEINSHKINVQWDRTGLWKLYVQDRILKSDDFTWNIGRLIISSKDSKVTWNVREEK